MKTNKAYLNKRMSAPSATSAIEIESFFTSFDTIEAKVTTTPSAPSVKNEVYGSTCENMASKASAPSAKQAPRTPADGLPSDIYTPLLTHARSAHARVSPTPGEIYAVRRPRLNNPRPLTEFEAARVPTGYDRDPTLLEEAGFCQLCKSPRLANFRGFGLPPGLCPVCWFRHGRAASLEAIR